MARVGWVSAQVEGTQPPEWYRITAWDDGWVDVPFLARTFSDARTQIRPVLRTTAVFVGGLFAIWLISMSFTDSTPAYMILLPVLLFAALMIYIAVVGIRRDLTSMRQHSGDAEQFKAMRDAGTLPKRKPGVKLLAIVRSAQQYSDSFTNTRLTRAADITAVELGRDGADYLATVHLADGTERTYRSPDKKLHKIVGHFARSVDRQR